MRNSRRVLAAVATATMVLVTMAGCPKGQPTTAAPSTLPSTTATVAAPAASKSAAPARVPDTSTCQGETRVELPTDQSNDRRLARVSSDGFASMDNPIVVCLRDKHGLWIAVSGPAQDSKLYLLNDGSSQSGRQPDVTKTTALKVNELVSTSRGDTELNFLTGKIGCAELITVTEGGWYVIDSKTFQQLVADPRCKLVNHGAVPFGLAKK